MRRILLLMQNPALAASQRLWLSTKGGMEESCISVQTVGPPPNPSVISNKFHGICDWIEAESRGSVNHHELPEIMVLTDLAGYGDIRPDQVNPVAYHEWASVLGMLVLAFPEVHWVLTSGNLSLENSKIGLDNAWREQCKLLHQASTPEALHNRLELGDTAFSPLFDSGGLRQFVRLSLQGASREEDRVNLPLRHALAVAVDEEQSYAYFHAYTAYRFGFRSHAITTMTAMKAFLNPDSTGSTINGSASPQPALVFEDVFLQFPDEANSGFSHLRKRDEMFPHLAYADYRIVVTSGHHHGQDEEARRDNLLYLRELRDNGKWNHRLQKPLGGIFNLWRDSGLDCRLQDGARRGLAPRFTWPLPIQRMEASHSAPGRILVVAERLIARAERMLGDVHTVPQAVYGAVLATEALELLAGRTPTTSLEALVLRHQFEAHAECQFVGTQHHVDVVSRITDVDREVSALSLWFGEDRRQRRVARWNAELAIVNKLIQVFGSHNQFDEEQVLQVCARRLHRKLWMDNHPFFKPVEWVPWYVEKLVASVPMFLGAIIGWIFVLGLLYWQAGATSLSSGLADAFVGFLGVQPPDDSNVWDSKSDGWNGAFCLIAVTVLLGFAHLGIFVSHLYSLITRK